MEERAEGGKSVVESALNLIDLVVLYAKQQIKDTVDKSIVGPIGTVARAAALLILAFTLFSIAAIFIAVGLFLLLAYLVGYILAYLLIGFILVLGGVVILWQLGGAELLKKRQGPPKSTSSSKKSTSKTASPKKQPQVTVAKAVKKAPPK